MKYKLVKKRLNYSGEQLISLWAYKTFNILGDSIVAFTGKCSVLKDKMVDVEDLKANSRIYSEEMLHFIIEHFGVDLENAVLRQRLFASIVNDELNEICKNLKFSRTGDDIYDNKGRKLSVSIATVSPVSCLIHFGINISSKNTPVAAVGLRDCKISPLKFANDIMKKYCDEVGSIEKCRCKVKWVQ